MVCLGDGCMDGQGRGLGTMGLGGVVGTEWRSVVGGRGWDGLDEVDGDE